MLKYFQKLLLVFLLSSCFSILTAEEEQYSLQEKTHKTLAKIQSLMVEKKLQDALNRLQALIQSLDKPYDRAIANQTLGYLYYQQNKFKDAITAFSKALEKEVLPMKVKQELLYVKAQLQIHTEDYKNGLQSLDTWFKTQTDANADAFILKASAHYQLEQFKQMIQPIKEALKRKKQAPANWYELLLAAFFETKQYKDATQILEYMIQRFPDQRHYWTQLIAVYQLRQLDKKALAVMELAYTNDYLDSDQILALAQSYTFLGEPYKAALVLEKEMASGKLNKGKDELELLLTSWLMAQENNDAINTLKELNSLHPSTQYAFQLGRLYYDLQDWNSTINSLKTVITDSTFKEYAEANLLYGIAHAELKNYSAAEKAFKRSLNYKSVKQTAEWWLYQIKQEQSS